ncbi:RsmB/NOP family class I SAM-dependent RNA methyltransferase [Caulobacter sp. S45]|uniref:RsmB/NOP family class I SAM-dependent RNA methyltransferase n=1 Tax=Caulobacter sp. S45 TaxID=1641861 RepID=UPI001576A6C0|nr:RsmB/NOP family class I SAM-dependent RNA methyltransferase [Caulobacter sp. S45]
MDAEAKSPHLQITPAPVEGLAARVAALDLLQAAVERRGGLEAALARAPFTTLAMRDRAFARALAGMVLRRLGPIDAALDARLQKPPPEAARWLLRLGAAQVLYMDVPVHAAVSVSVEQASGANATRPYKGLVNAVLRGLARDGSPAGEPEALAPPWLLARWRTAFGGALARDIAAVIADEPPTDLTLKQDVGDALVQALQAERLITGGLRTSLKGEIFDWPGFAEGVWWVQDAAAAMPARLLDVYPGWTVLDMCAAPGGKTLQLAAAGGRVTALDRSAARLKRLHENLARTHLSAEVVVAEACAWVDPRSFDAVLLDAPCSATGTFRRHPDVLWAARPGDIARLAALQARLLDAAAERVRPGGRLVYCVCSLEPEEGERQAQAFLQIRPDFEIAPVAAGEAGAPARAITPQGFVRLLPGPAEPELGGDGFFVARFVRRPA